MQPQVISFRLELGDIFIPTKTGHFLENSDAVFADFYPVLSCSLLCLDPASLVGDHVCSIRSPFSNQVVIIEIPVHIYSVAIKMHVQNA